MAKELRLDVVVRKDDKALAELATEFEAAAKEAEASGKKINTTFTQQVDTKLKDTQKQLQSLRTEFAKTGNIGLVGDIRNLEKELRNLEKTQKSLLPNIGGGGAGAEGLLTKVLQFGGPAAPLVGAAGGGLILGALGVGTIAAGIIGQLKDPTVKAELQTFKADAGRIFGDATQPFGGVLIHGLEDADATLRKVAPELKALFTAAAPGAEKLFEGVDGFVEKALPGLQKGVQGANIIIGELGKDLPAVGKSIGDAFAGAAEGAQGDAAAFHDLLFVVDQVITASGQAAGAAGQLYGGLRDVATGKFGDLKKDFDWKDVIPTLISGGLYPLGKELFNVVKGQKDVTYQVVGLNGALDDQTATAARDAAAMHKLDGEVQNMLRSQLAAADSADAFQKGLNDLGTQLDQNNHTLVGNTDAAIQNRTVIRNLIEDAERTREKQIELAGGVNASKQSIDQANASYDAAIKKIIDTGTQSHLLKGDLEALAGQYTIEIVTAVAAINNSGLAQNITAHDPGRKGTKRASGGPVTAGQPYIVGENQPELFVPNVNGTIIPKLPAPVPYAAPRAGQWTGAGAMSAPPVHVRIFLGDRELTDIVRVEVDAAHNQTAAAATGGVRV